MTNPDSLSPDAPWEILAHEATPKPSRRSVIGRGLAAAATAALLADSSSAEAASNSGSPPSLYTGWNRRNFVQIRTNENSHLGIVITAIQSLGGTPRPKPTFSNLEANSLLELAQMSATFENTGTAAYFGGAPYIANPAVAAVANSLGFVEAYQSGWLNSLLNRPLIPTGQPYAVPFTPPQVLAVQSPFIASFNDNGLFPPTFAFEKSPANDIAILNFALIQEYLEVEFYNLNLPRFFSGV